MNLKDRTYWVVHLKNGVSLYTPDEFHLAESGSDPSLYGLDGEIYEFPSEAVLLVHRSTPESRAFYVQLTVSINEEMMSVKQELLDKAMKEGEKEHRTSSAVDAVVSRLGRPGPRPVES